MSNLFNLGITGLLAFQKSLGTTGHNIVNANTEGYSRQVSVLSTRAPQVLGGQMLGNGVDVEQTKRVFDEYMVTQLRQSISSYYHSETLHEYASQMDSLIADSNTGLTSSMQDFFNAMEGLADDPGSIPARQVVVTQGEILSNRFHRLNEQFADISTVINEQFTQLATEITALASSIAELNASIVQAYSGQSGDPPNDLLDKRDRLISELSEIVNLTAANNADGSVNIFIGNGDGLVIGPRANTISVVSDSTDNTELTLAMSVGSVQQVLTFSQLGGKIGGLIEFRDTILKPTQNALGRIAIGLAETMNAQHKLGIDLNGLLGGNFFNDMTTVNASMDSNNVGSASVSIDITDVKVLTTSDYEIDFNGAYTLTRLSDGKVIGSYPAGTTNISSEGFSLIISGAAISGDKFLIRPTRNAAGSLKMLITEAKDIAAASPVRATTNSNNTGAGIIDQGVVTSTAGAEFTTTSGALTPPLLVQFTSATTYDIYNNSNPSAPVMLLSGNAFTPGQSNQIIPGALNYGYQFNLSGAPDTGDRFQIDYNSGSVSDNRNALLLASLASKNTLNGSTSTYQQTYGQLVADIGNKTRESSISEDANLGLLRQSEARQESVSGVNLDEEAANLLKFQQAYQAAAQIFNAARNIFDVLFDATRG